MSRSTSLHWWHTLKSQCLCLPPTVSALLMGCLHHLFGANFAPNFAPKVSPLACHFSLLFLNRSQNLSHSFWTSLVQYTTSTLEPRVAISQSRNRKCKHLNLECGHYHGQPNLVWYDFERFQTIYCTIELLPDVKTELEQWATTLPPFDPSFAFKSKSNRSRNSRLNRREERLRCSKPAISGWAA